MSRLIGYMARMDNESELIVRAQQGDEAAFTELLSQYYPMLVRVAFKWCANATDAEDIAQEAAIKIGAAVAQFRQDSAFSSWVYRIVVNLTKDKLRRQRLDMLINEAPDIPDTSNGLEQQVMVKQLWEQVRTLPESQCDAMLLVYSEGLSHAEAAHVLECAESTVSWHIHNAKKTLSQMNQDYE